MMKAWHFTGSTLRDGSPIPPDGEWLEHSGKLRMCRLGLHASRRALDALRYAPGSTLCRVECAGATIEDDDKLVCSRRKILWRLDATELLRAFARHEALSVADAWDPPDAVLRWLLKGRGEDRSAAYWAARSAARSAARAAARAAAYWAARSAARAAYWAADWAARSAARSAAYWAARSAADSAAAWAAEAAGAAARSAAYWAARSAAEETLQSMIREARDEGVNHWEWTL